MLNSIFTTKFLEAYFYWFLKIIQYTGSLFFAIIFNSLMIMLVYKSDDIKTNPGIFGLDVEKKPYLYVGTYNCGKEGYNCEPGKSTKILQFYDLQSGEDNMLAYFNLKNYSMPYNWINYGNWRSFFITPILFGFWSYRWMLWQILKTINPGYPNHLLGDLYRNFINKLLLTLGPVFLMLICLLIVFPYSMGVSILAAITEQPIDLRKYQPTFTSFSLVDMFTFGGLSLLYYLSLVVITIVVAIFSILFMGLCWLSGIQFSLMAWYFLPLWGLTNGNFIKQLLPILKYNQEFILTLIVLIVYLAATSTLVDYPNVVNGIGIVVLVTVLIMIIRMLMRVSGCFNSTGFGFNNVDTKAYKCST